MKTIITILFNVFLIQIAISQNIEKLDEKNGFKDFTLGDNYSKWQNQLNSETNLEDGTKSYLYTGICCQKVFDYSVEKIQLRFSKTKLVGIRITTMNFQKSEDTTWRPDDFESINSSFSYLFGEHTSIDKPEKSGNLTYIWEGKKVVLFSTYEFLGTMVGDRQVITLADLTFINEGIENGF